LIVWKDGGGCDFCGELDINVEIKEFGGHGLGETGGSSFDDCLSASDLGEVSLIRRHSVSKKTDTIEGKNSGNFNSPR